MSRAAFSGQEIRVWAAMSLEVDCTPHGSMISRMVEPPRHGSARFVDEAFFPTYMAPNPRAACNARKAPGRELFYASEAGFKGSDMVVIENATSEGMIRKTIIDIDVR